MTVKLNVAEELLAGQLTESKIEFERQYHYVPKKKFAADFLLNDYNILVEVQGGVFNKRAHGSITGILNDIKRLNLATFHGYFVLRFTPQQCLKGEAIAFIKEVTAGWYD